MHTTNTKEIVVGGLPVVCREMTVLQVRQWLADEERMVGEVDPVALVLFPDCTFDELMRMTDLTQEKIDQLRPSELQQVVDACKGLNSHFFALLGRMTAARVAQAAG